MKLKFKAGSFCRAALIGTDGINAELRALRFPFSSEEPVKRVTEETGEIYYEILDHSPSSVRMERMNSSAPLHYDHEYHIGIVDKMELGADRRGYVEVHLGKGALADEKWNDITDTKILRNASFHYDVFSYRCVGECEGYPLLRSFDWEPYDVSLMGAQDPADYKVGLGRGAEHQHEIVIEGLKETPQSREKETKNMKYCSICGKALVDGVCPDKCRATEIKPPVDEIKVREAAVTSERTRQAEITAIADKFPQVKNIRELVQKHIADGTEVPQFRGVVLEALGVLTPVVDTNLGMSKKEVEKFSFRKAILAVGDNDWREAGFEREVSRATEKLLGRTAQGCMVPQEVMVARLDGRGVGDSLTNLTPAAGPGSNLIATNLLAGSFIEMLRARMILQNLGIITIGGLVGDVAIPKQTGGATAYWIAKDGTITNKSALEILQVALTPHTVGAYTELGRNLLKQSTPDAEGLVRLDLATCMALSLVQAGISGSGQTNEPTGILATNNIGAVAMGVSGGAPTWAKIIELWSSVALDNADFGTTAFLTNAAVIGKLMSTEKATGTAKYICESFPDSSGFTVVGGGRCAVSNQVPSDLTKLAATGLSAMIFGNFASLVMGLWGGLDITKDPYALATSGGIRIVMLQDVDFALRHPESFSASKDIVAP